VVGSAEYGVPGVPVTGFEPEPFAIVVDVVVVDVVVVGVVVDVVLVVVVLVDPGFADVAGSPVPVVGVPGVDAAGLPAADVVGVVGVDDGLGSVTDGRVVASVMEMRCWVAPVTRVVVAGEEGGAVRATTPCGDDAVAGAAAGGDCG
jgi:hypothetical protein